MANDPCGFETLRRYKTTIERAWYRSIRERKAAQKERRESEEKAHNAPPENTVAEIRSQAAQATTKPTRATRAGHVTKRTNPGKSPKQNAHGLPGPPMRQEKNSPASAQSPLSENGIRCVSQSQVSTLWFSPSFLAN